ncbi:MAG: ATP-binding protein [Bacteroidales bacterium]|nr:ATP-binding protein [Bacteroidales bacterium]
MDKAFHRRIKEIIFDRFKKLNSEINSINRGHGLGLSIVKAFIDFLEGQIELESTPGAGSVFTIHIPRSSGEIEGFTNDGYEVFFGEEQF